MLASLAGLMHQPNLVSAERPGSMVLSLEPTGHGAVHHGANAPEKASDAHSQEQQGNEAEDHEPQVSYQGKSIEITDPEVSKVNPRLQRGMYGFIITEATVPGATDFEHKNFWVNIDHLAVNVFLTGQQIRITQLEGKQRADLEDSCIKMLRPPARNELQVHNSKNAGLEKERDPETNRVVPKIPMLWKSQYGKVLKYKGIKTYDGLQEEEYEVQMQGARLQPYGKPIFLLRHEFEHVECPERAATASHEFNIPIGSRVIVINPMQGDTRYQAMLSNQLGKVVAHNDLSGMYVVELETYKKNAEFLPAEIEIYIPHLEVAEHKKPNKGDCNYTNLLKHADAQDRALSKVDADLTTMVDGSVKKLIAGHNQYVGKLWTNHVYLDNMAENIDTFKARSAEDDEKASAQVGLSVEKGMKEVSANAVLAQKLRAYYAEKFKRLSGEHYRTRATWRNWEQHKDHDDWMLLHKWAKKAEDDSQGAKDVATVE